MNKEIC